MARKTRRRRRRSISIPKKMRGVFTRKAKKAHKTVQQYAKQVIKQLKGKTHGNKAKTKLLRQAVFARNAKKWKRRSRRRSRRR